MDDAQLLKLAEAELLHEAKRGAVRHSTAGPSGWKSCPKTNKSFLVNTLLQTLQSNRILSNKKTDKDKKNKMKGKTRKMLQKSDVNKSCNFTYKKPVKSKELRKNDGTDQDNKETLKKKCRSMIKDQKPLRKSKLKEHT